MVGIKNIIIIGKVGSGKSALANVLSGTEVFKEESSSVTEIWRAKDKEFEVKKEGNRNNKDEKILQPESEIEQLKNQNSETQTHEQKNKSTKYRVIDTIGLGDTSLNKEELLEKFEEEIGNYIDEGISQIFFVIGEKLDREVLTEFFWLNEYLFDGKAPDYTTVVRNRFNNFEKKEECKKDAEELTNILTCFFDNIGKDKEISEEIKKGFIEKGVIYIDNQPITEPDEEDDEDDLRKRKLSKEQRQKSRKVLLDYLNNSNTEEHYKPETIKWLDENYPFESERKKMLVLDISKRNLKGRLNLKGFTNLRRLNCADNQLTSLDLIDCPNLIELKCNNNQFTNLNFLKSVSNLEKLEIQNNQNLFPQSLKVLENLNKLEELNINNTNLSEGWECLLKNCWKLCCNSEEIMEELNKKGCLDNDYYNLDQWRETNKQNNLTASVIPLERLFVIRSNIKKFADKWGIREDNNENKKDHKLKNCLTWSYNKISKLWKQDKNLSELSKLKDPKDSSKLWWVNTTVQWANRATLVAGGSLVLVGQSDTDNPHSQLYTQTGGVIAIAGPFVEILTSTLNTKIFEDKQRKWDEFVADTKNMLDSYHELLGILEKIEIRKLGDVNKSLKNLDKVADSFLANYDVDHNETISVFEILEEQNRKKLAEDLSKKDNEAKSQLDNIIKAIENLEEEVTKYRQGATDQENIEQKSKVERKEKEQPENKVEAAKNEEVVTELNNQDTAIAIDEKEQNEIATQIEIK